MRSILVLLLAAAVCPAQEAPRITLEGKAKLSEHLRAIEKATACRIPFDGVDDREITVSVKDAGFFQALDAVCRAHGGATYMDFDEQLTSEDKAPLRLNVGEPLEYPAAYHESFKVLVSAMNRFHSRSVDGKASWTCIHLVLIGPPSVNVNWQSGASASWKFVDARDTAGTSVLPAEGRTFRQQIALAESQQVGGNSASESVHLEDFDLEKGLALLSGEVKMTTADTKEVTIPLVPGKEVEVPGGKIVVDGVRDHAENSWKVAMTFKPAAEGETELSKHIENRVHCGRDWEYLGLPYKGNSFEFETSNLRNKPTTAKLRFRLGERVLTIPFELRNVRFKKA